MAEEYTTTIDKIVNTAVNLFFLVFVLSMRLDNSVREGGGVMLLLLEVSLLLYHLLPRMTVVG